MIASKIKNLIKRSFFYDFYRHGKQLADFLFWGQYRKGSLTYLGRQKLIKDFAEKFGINILVETGTFLGDVIYWNKNNFKRIYSVELNEYFFWRAKKKFSSLPHVSVIYGDSGEMLKHILRDINEPCLFWLDAHYSGGPTSKGSVDTPIIQELANILNHSVSRHVILIDDAHCFDGRNGYPTMQELKKNIAGKRPDYLFEVKDNIIRIYKIYDNG